MRYPEPLRDLRVRAAIAFAVGCMAFGIASLVWSVRGAVMVGAVGTTASVVPLFLLFTEPTHRLDTTERADRERVRDALKLRPLRQLEVGQRIDRLPPGVYGFAEPPDWQAPALASSLLKPPWELEVQKVAPGDVRLAVYVSDEMALRLSDASGPPRQREVMLYPRRRGQGSVLVSVPLDAVVSASARRYSDTREWVLDAVVELPIVIERSA